MNSVYRMPEILYNRTGLWGFCSAEDGPEIDVIRIERLNELLDAGDVWLKNYFYINL